ncbi:hypothetical protein GCM10009775_18070 [Microbacterium aoyamense]|uniref:DUF3499 family protein n=2 Tax=Microbacteriaceae TaxID=85023 RepID=A0ABN2PR57_9MICO
MRPSYGGQASVRRRGIPIHLVGGISVEAMRERLCSKVGCAREAVSTLTYDYGDQMAAVGPLGAGGDPHAHDLCAIHTERLSVPKGWVVVRHETLRV